jgi:hypothetical protein
LVCDCVAQWRRCWSCWYPLMLTHTLNCHAKRQQVPQ